MYSLSSVNHLWSRWHQHQTLVHQMTSLSITQVPDYIIISHSCTSCISINHSCTRWHLYQPLILEMIPLYTTHAQASLSTMQQMTTSNNLTTHGLVSLIMLNKFIQINVLIIICQPLMVQMTSTSNTRAPDDITIYHTSTRLHHY